MAKVNSQPPVGARVAAPDPDPDLVDRIFEYLIELSPEIAAKAERLAELKSAVRGEFAGETAFIPRTGSKGERERKRQETARQVLSLFNGRNSTEVARRLQISRATVFRLIKQAGGLPKPG